MEEKKIDLGVSGIISDVTDRDKDALSVIATHFVSFAQKCEIQFQNISDRLTKIEQKIESRFSLAKAISSHKKTTGLVILMAILLIYAYGEHQRGLPPRENSNFIIRIIHGIVEKNTGFDLNNKP